jgi:hypothetical protein
VALWLFRLPLEIEGMGVIGHELRRGWGSYLPLWLFPLPLEIGGMELSGALWNLYVQGRLPRLAALHKRLLARTPETGVVGRPIRRRQGALLEAVTTVLELAGCPLRVREVHAAVEELYGERVPFSSVNEALSTHANSDGSRFCRVRYGTYAMAGR